MPGPSEGLGVVKLMRHEGVQAVRDALLVDEFLDRLGSETVVLRRLVNGSSAGRLRNTNWRVDSLDNCERKRYSQGERWNAGAFHACRCYAQKRRSAHFQVKERAARYRTALGLIPLRQ